MKKLLTLTAVSSLIFWTAQDAQAHGNHKHHHHHQEVNIGKNGGRLLKKLNAEILVTPEKRIQIQFFDKKGKPTAANKVFFVRVNKRAVDIEKKGTAYLTPTTTFPATIRVINNKKIEILKISLKTCKKGKHPQYLCTCHNKKK